MQSDSDSEEEIEEPLQSIPTGNFNAYHQHSLKLIEIEKYLGINNNQNPNSNLVLCQDKKTLELNKKELESILSTYTNLLKIGMKSQPNIQQQIERTNKLLKQINDLLNLCEVNLKANELIDFENEKLPGGNSFKPLIAKKPTGEHDTEELKNIRNMIKQTLVTETCDFPTFNEYAGGEKFASIVQQTITNYFGPEGYTLGREKNLKMQLVFFFMDQEVLVNLNLLELLLVNL